MKERLDEEGRGGRPPSHTCGIYLDSQDFDDYASSFVQDGLESGERVVWLHDGFAHERVTAVLRYRDVDVERYEAADRLAFRPAQGSFASDGPFDILTALTLIRNEAVRTEEAGFSGLRVVQELGPSLVMERGPSRVMEYEERLNSLLDELETCTVLCGYDRRAAPDRAILRSLELHPHLVQKGRSVENIYFLPSTGEPIANSSEILDTRLSFVGGYVRGQAAHRRNRALIRLLQAIHRAAEAARTAEDALRVLLGELCRYTGFPVGHVYRMSESDGRLSSSRIWHVDDAERIEPFVTATEEVRFEWGRGLPGQAWAARKPVWMSDASRDPDFVRGESAKTSGMRAALATPVTANGEVVAVVELYSFEPGDPDEDLISVMEPLGGQLGDMIREKRVEEALGAHKDRLQALEEGVDDAIVIADEDARIETCNGAATALFGYSAAELRGKPLTLILPSLVRGSEGGASELEGVLGHEARRDQRQTRTLPGRTKDGRELSVEASFAAWSSGDRMFLAAIVRDVTQEREVESELRLLESAVQNLQEAVMVTTGTWRGTGPTILYVNPGFTEMTGYSEAEVLGRGIRRILGPKTDDQALRRLRRSLEEGESSAVEVIAYGKEGSEFLMHWQATPVRSPGGQLTHVVSIQRDVTEERMAEEALHRAERDTLTGLANRQLLLRRLGRAVERAASDPTYEYALLFLDLDGFKAVNDSLGHLLGDQLLAAAALRVERTVRPGDTVSRFGGDEFVVLLEHLGDVTDILLVTERIRSGLELPFELDETTVSISASIGIALSQERYETPDHVIEDADAAMYRAKEGGGARFEFFDSKVHEEAVTTFQLNADLQRAVEEGAFRLTYQPLVSLDSGRIIGFEALLRWDHPERGEISPAHFIPLAEQGELIREIDDWVLRESCRQLREWQGLFESRDPLFISVNISPRELRYPDFVDRIRAAVEEAGIDGSNLQIEITENAFIEGQEEVRSQLEEVRSMGVRVCLDDFGTGYSSLSYLHRFPVGFIKIDRAFVARMSGGNGAGEIVRTILTLGENLGIEVLAEGVETREQFDALRRLSCHFGQGFLFSRPIPGPEVEALVVGNGDGNGNGGTFTI